MRAAGGFVQPRRVATLEFSIMLGPNSGGQCISLCPAIFGRRGIAASIPVTSPTIPAAECVAATRRAKLWLRQSEVGAHHRFELRPLFGREHFEQLVAGFESQLADFLVEVFLYFLRFLADLVALGFGQPQSFGELAFGQGGCSASLDPRLDVDLFEPVELVWH